MFADLDMSQQCGCRAPDVAQYGRFNPPAYVCSVCGCNATHLFDKEDRVDLHRKEVKRRKVVRFATPPVCTDAWTDADWDRYAPGYIREKRLIRAGWRIIPVPDVNSEGLTLDEWRDAAGGYDNALQMAHFRAWSEGEDPTEWRKGGL